MVATSPSPSSELHGAPWSICFLASPLAAASIDAATRKSKRARKRSRTYPSMSDPAAVHRDMLARDRLADLTDLRAVPVGETSSTPSRQVGGWPVAQRRRTYA
jgi:hypothetical protein